MVENGLAAVAAIAARAGEARSADLVRLGRALGEPVDVVEDRIERQLVAGVCRHARITLNFHPDRRGGDGASVAEGLLQTGRYRPQDETGLSNGGRSAVPGGDRFRWERSLFGDAYETGPATRPIYGALDLTSDPLGGSPRFGSSFVVLNRTCLERATFCVGDSHVGPVDVGVSECFTGILAGLFEQGVAGVGLDRSLTVADLRGVIEQGERADRPARSLDGYIEAQIHGGVSLADDVAAIVVDPSFRSTEIEEHLMAAAGRHGFTLGWHGGSELSAADVPADFRGPDMPGLARRVARPDGIVDAAAIGRLARLVPFTPPTPTGDAPNSDLQQYKYLWHCLLRFGSDRA